MGLSMKNMKPNLAAMKEMMVARHKTKKNIQGVGMAAYKGHMNSMKDMPPMERGYNANANIASAKAKEAIKGMKKQIPKKYR